MHDSFHDMSDMTSMTTIWCLQCVWSLISKHSSKLCKAQVLCKHCDKHSTLTHFYQSLLHMYLWSFAWNYPCLWFSLKKPVSVAYRRGSRQEASEQENLKPIQPGHDIPSNFGNFHSTSPISLCHNNGTVLHPVGNPLSGRLLALQGCALTGYLIWSNLVCFQADIRAKL